MRSTRHSWATGLDSANWTCGSRTEPMTYLVGGPCRRAVHRTLRRTDRILSHASRHGCEAIASARANQNSDQEHAVLQIKRRSPRRYRLLLFGSIAENISDDCARHLRLTRHEQSRRRDGLGEVGACGGWQGALCQTNATVWRARFSFGAGAFERPLSSATAGVQPPLHGGLQHRGRSSA